ncbi:MAG: transcriptional regulator, LysR family [Anaerosporomusa subterranea]|jgi:DNA-binding transcriptional LysR family regulator|nr:transcriptional regulator, LysR family [Anaerosporomusa subterranea]
MNTIEIEAFLAILRHGNLTEAAKALFISQSTLSHRLFELEREVGMSLIERGRGGKSLVLTDYGKQFLLIAKRWENLVQDTKRLQSQTNNLSLSIGAVDTFHTFIFPPLYQALCEHMPKINLNLKTHNSTELYLQVDRGEIDVGFTLLDLPMRNITVQKIYTERRVVLRKEKSTNKCDDFIDPESLDPAGEIFFVGDTAFHTWYQCWKGEKGYPSLQVDTTQLLLLLLNKVGNWSIVPMCIAQKLVSMGSYSYYRLEDPPPERICYKIQSKYLNASVAEGIGILDSYLASVLNKE